MKEILIKKMPIKKLIIFLVSICNFVQADGLLPQQSLISKVVDQVGQSNFMDAYSRNVQGRVEHLGENFRPYGNEPASQKYQDLGLQAQLALGIPVGRCLPILKIDPNSSHSKNITAIAKANAIYVNEDKFAKMSYGAQRSAMYHESVHAQYHDAAALGLLKQAGFLGGFIGIHTALKSFKVVALRKSLSCLSGVIVLGYLVWKYRQFMERRADEQGHYATNCSCCVQEAIEDKTRMFQHAALQSLNSMPEEIRKSTEKMMQERFKERDATELMEDFECCQGYLHRSDLKKIAQDLGGQKCAYHLEEKK